MLSDTLGSVEKNIEDETRRDRATSNMFNNNNSYYLLYAALNSAWITSFNPHKSLWTKWTHYGHLTMANWGLKWNNSTNYLACLYKSILAMAAYATRVLDKSLKYSCVLLASGTDRKIIFYNIPWGFIVLTL